MSAGSPAGPDSANHETAVSVLVALILEGLRDREIRQAVALDVTAIGITLPARI